MTDRTPDILARITFERHPDHPLGLVAVMDILPPVDAAGTIAEIARAMPYLKCINIDPIERIGLDAYTLSTLRDLARVLDIPVAMVTRADHPPPPDIAAQIDVLISYQELSTRYIPPEGVDPLSVMPKGKLSLIY